VLQKQEYNKLVFWIEEYLFYPKISHKILSYALLPFSAIYCLLVILKREFTKQKDFDIPIISIGNLTIGGNGKTPFTIALAKDRVDTAVILRGYKRESTDLLVVKEDGKISCDVKDSGDEAMLYAKELPNAMVLVCKNRALAIEYAAKKSIKSIFLDDAFHRHEIKKFDILLEPQKEYTNNFCLPSGPYREPKSFSKKADIVAKEGVDFNRNVFIKNQTKKMLLITAISKPQRLDKFLPKDSIIAKIYFEDHHFYQKKELDNIIKKYNPTSILTTTKDAVKLEKFGYDLSILELNVSINKNIILKINSFIDNFGNF